MEKLMSFFQPTEKRKPAKYGEEDGDTSRSETPPPDERRKWSISRSGRMKQANKKRHSVAKDLYGETFTPVEKPTSLEYHVNTPVTKPTQQSARPGPNTDMTPDPKAITLEPKDLNPEPKSPEEEIESAFEILDRVDKAS